MFILHTGILIIRAVLELRNGKVYNSSFVSVFSILVANDKHTASTGKRAIETV
jgi:hypothetical protein